MKIVVTGGAGAMAFPAITYLLDQKDVTRVLLTDLDKSKLDERIAHLGDARVVGMVLDLMDTESLAQALEGADVVLNAAVMATCSSVTKAALAAAVNYTDFGGTELENQMTFDEAFRDKGITAVPAIGTAPGMSNIMSAYIVEKLDRVDSIDIKDVCANLVPHKDHSRTLHWGFDINGILNEFSKEAPVMEDGEINYYPPRSYPEIYGFRPPAGPSHVAVTRHSEVLMFAKSFKDKGLRNATWKIGFEPEFEEKLLFLNSLGFAQEEPIDVDGQMVSPRAVLLNLLHTQPLETKRPPDFRGHMAVVVKGNENGQKVEYTITEYATDALTERMQAKGVFSSYRTGIYGAILTLMLARGQIEKKGVFYPEVSVPAEAFIREAVRVGIEIEVERKTLIEA